LAAYTVAEAFDWKASLNLKLKTAHSFYGVITIATLIGITINFVGIDPVKALVFTAVLNSVAAVPLLFLIVRIVASEEVMGEYKSGWFRKLCYGLPLLPWEPLLSPCFSQFEYTIEADKWSCGV
jgi:Mn2+/Fe2+ NRAMP family transporter